MESLPASDIETETQLERVPPTNWPETAVAAADQPRRRLLAVSPSRCGIRRVKELIAEFEPDGLIWLGAATGVPDRYRERSFAMDKRGGPHTKNVSGRTEKLGKLTIIGLGSRSDRYDEIKKDREGAPLLADILVTCAMRSPGGAVGVLEYVTAHAPRLVIADTDQDTHVESRDTDTPRQSQILSVREWAVIDMDKMTLDIVATDAG